MTAALLDWLFGRRLARDRKRYLRELIYAAEAASRKSATDLLRQLAAAEGPMVTVGTTPWGQQVALPVADVVEAYGIVNGATGSGKSRVGLNIFEALLEAILSRRGDVHGCAELDAKGDLFHGGLFLISKRLQYLDRVDPRAAEDLRRRIVIIDFAAGDPLTSYNIFARWNGTKPDFFAASRADLLLDLLPGPDRLSLGANGVLKKLILLLSEFSLPITKMAEVATDERLRAKLVARCPNSELAAYFARQFPLVPKSIIAAILRRIEALFDSESVRLALSGTSAPDFRRLQDEGSIVFIKTFGQEIPRCVQRLLQAVVLFDVAQTVFARSCHLPFLWLCDEAQNFFLTEKLREHMSQLLTMSRSFGSFFLFFTQNMSTAVQDARMLKILHTNIRWSLSLRDDPSDCAFLKAALPVTGRRPKPQADPFAERRFYSIAEERSLLLDEIARLPDRTGYLWLKSRGAEAIPIETADVSLPQSDEIERATAAIREDPSIGGRVSRKQYLELIAEREREWNEESGDVGDMLEQAYASTRRAATA